MSETERPGPAKVPEFQLVSDREEARKLLKEGFRTLAACMIWTREQKHVVNTQLSVLLEDEGVFYAAIPSNVDPAWFKDQLVELGSHDCFVSVSLARATIFFKAALLNHDDGGFRFQLPQGIYKVQRRKNARLFVPFGRVIRVEIQDPTFPEQKLSKKIFDISAGGLSFVVTDAESALFTAGTVFKGMAFAIGSRRILVDGEVRHNKVQPDESAQPGYKIGLLFTRISSADAQWIAAFVFEESRKVATKFM